MFTASSRYVNLATSMIQTYDGRMIVYVSRRIIPLFSGSAVVEHQVVESDRLDNITAQYLGDSEQFWRVCDQNTALRPDDLTAKVGRRLYIPYPIGG